MMRSVCLLMTRLLLSAWVGAATLFVVTSVSEQRSPQFDSATKSALAAIRFPSYYLFAFAMIVGALLCGGVAKGHQDFRGKRSTMTLILILMALVLFIADYIWIYLPLESMMLQEAARIEPTFSQLHHASMWVNLADLILILLAALLACKPGRSEPRASLSGTQSQ